MKTNIKGETQKVKKVISVLTLLALLASLLIVPAVAADAPTTGGIYDLVIDDAFKSTTTVVVQDEAGTAITAKDAAVDGGTVQFYADAVKIKVSLSGLTDGKYYLILAQNEDTVPTAGNIVYIDQDTVSEGEVGFTVYPGSLTAGPYYVSLAGSDSAKAALLSFKYYVAYKLGDVNEDKAVNATDALWILQNYAGNRDFSANQKLAGDVNHDKAVNATDALWVLQAFAGNRTLS